MTADCAAKEQKSTRLTTILRNFHRNNSQAWLTHSHHAEGAHTMECWYIEQGEVSGTEY